MSKKKVSSEPNLKGTLVSVLRRYHYYRHVVCGLRSLRFKIKGKVGEEYALA